MNEYLVSFGVTGEFTRFRSAESLQRGDRVVLRGNRGLELGTVLREATAHLNGMLADNLVGDVVRRATPDDEAFGQSNQKQSQQLFEKCRRLAAAMNLPLEVLDVEIPLQGQATLHILGFEGQALIDALARQGIEATLHNLAVPPEPAGCGEPDCGQTKGGCSSCSSGGGCGTGCGSPQMTRDVSEYFAALRKKMEGQYQRTSLL